MLARLFSSITRKRARKAAERAALAVAAAEAAFRAAKASYDDACDRGSKREMGERWPRLFAAQTALTEARLQEARGLS